MNDAELTKLLSDTAPRFLKIMGQLRADRMRLRQEVKDKQECIHAMAETCAKYAKEIEELKGPTHHYPYVIE